jgi:anti-sigma B factor antagonist
MATKKKSEGDVSTLVIDGEMTIYRAAELKPLLLEALAKVPALEVDLSGVTELDSAGLQILILAKQTALQTSRELHLLAHSPAVIEIFEMLDLAAYFGDALVIASRNNTGNSARM